MPSAKKILELSVFGVLIPVLLAAAAVGPEDATSNLAKWATELGVANVPHWLSSPSIDRTVIEWGLPIWVASLVAIFLVIPYLRRHKQQWSHVKPEPPPQPVLTAPFDQSPQRMLDSIEMEDGFNSETAKHYPHRAGQHQKETFVVGSKKWSFYFWHIPLQNALQHCFEVCEKLPVGKVVARLNVTPHTRLSWFWASFIEKKVQVYGSKPPSRIAHPIPADEMRGLLLREGTNDLRDLYQTDTTLYKNVYVRRPDLSTHIRYLRTLSEPVS